MLHIFAMSATTTLPKTIDVREAAAKAAEYFKQLYSSPEVRSVSLEEVELSENGKQWLITLSYTFGENEGGVFFGIPKTKYKVFTVDAKTGKVTAMKIRKLEN